jgi:hypothetical protein
MAGSQMQAAVEYAFFQFRGSADIDVEVDVVAPGNEPLSGARYAVSRSKDSGKSS